MQYIHYFRNKNFNQVIFNRKVNWFFDIKTIHYQNHKKKILSNFASQLSKEYYLLKKKKKLVKNKKYKKVQSSKIIIQRYSKHKKIIKIIKTIQKLKMEKYFKHFLIQGSVASLDFINGYSDFDTFVVLKDNVLKDKKKILELRSKLKKLYIDIKSFCKLQHHGLIIYTEYDIDNYLKGYLPMAALKKNKNIFKTEKISFNLIKGKNINLSKKILIERKNFLVSSLKSKKYNHHVRGKKIPSIPFRSGDPFLFELFYQIGTIMNIPILYLDAIGKSSHKKISFLKFYKIIKNKFIINFIKKHEKLRKNWKNYNNTKFKISKKLLDYLGSDYISDCLKLYKQLLIKL